MTSKRRRLAAVIASLLSLSINDQILAQSSPLTPADRALFAWFDDLGYAPSLEGKPLVRVSTGDWSQRPGDTQKTPWFSLGLLLEEQGDHFTVFLLSTRTSNLVRRPSSADEVAVGYERLDLARAGAKELALARGERFPDTLDLFVLARVCAAAHLDRLARDLLRQAERGARDEGLKTSLGWAIRSLQAGDLFERYERGLPRPLFRSGLAQLDRNFPEPDDARAAMQRALIPVLDRMAAETAIVPAPPAGTPVETTTQVAELIRALEDQPGQQAMFPGYPSFLHHWDRTRLFPGSTAERLVQVGYRAVPQLIDALHDDRLTRAVDWYRAGKPNTVLRVSDCAMEILEEIAGRDFGDGVGRSISDEERWRAVQSNVLHWWQSFERKGEKQSLIDDTLAGYATSAKWLLERFPDVGFATLRRAIDASARNGKQAALIAVVATVPTEEATNLLNRALSFSDVESRVEAARALKSRGVTAPAIDAMIDVWTTTHFTLEGSSLGWLEETVAQFLVESSEPRAIRALAVGWDTHGFGARFTLSNTWLSEAGSQPSLREDVEAVLVVALTDATVKKGFQSISTGGRSWSDPRICDVAADALATLWPKKYRFDARASLASRDRQRIKLENTWRAEHGLPPLPPIRETAK